MNEKQDDSSSSGDCARPHGDTQEFSLKTPVLSLSSRTKAMAELISILSLCAMIGVGAALYLHSEETKANYQALAKTLEALLKAQQESNKAQRELICIIALPQEKREAQLDGTNTFCRRLARGN